MKNFDLPIEVAGIKFKNPFYVASGPTTKSLRQLQEIEKTGWAAASIKLTMDPVPYINRKPRYGLFHDRDALAFTAEKRLDMEEGLRLIESGKKALKDLILMANITYAGDDGVEGWLRMAKRFEDAGADIIELNMCCPNMSYNVELTKGEIQEGKHTGASMGSDPEIASEIAGAIKQAIKIPLFVKLTPEGGQIAKVAHALYNVGVDAVGSTANRLGIPVIDLNKPTQAIYHLQDEISMSCHSSGWLKPLAQRDTYEIRKVNGDEPVITATEGIRSWQDAVEMIMCGANLLGICGETLIQGYDIVKPIISGVKDYMKSHNYTFMDDYRSLIVPEVKSAPELTLHDGHAWLTQPKLAAPCKSACPHHVPVQAYIYYVAVGNTQKAYEILSEFSPLQEFCAYICDAPCEEACIRGSLDRPIAIKEIKKYIFKEAEKNSWSYKVPYSSKLNKKIVLKGLNINHLSTAVALCRAGYDVEIISRYQDLTQEIRQNYIEDHIPQAVVMRVLDRVREEGVVLTEGKTDGEVKAATDLEAFISEIPVATEADKQKLIVFEGNGSNLYEAMFLALEAGFTNLTLITSGPKRFTSTMVSALKGKGVEIFEGVNLGDAEINENGQIELALSLDGFEKIIYTDKFVRAGRTSSIIREIADGQNNAAQIDRKERGDESTVHTMKDDKFPVVSRKKVIARQQPSVLTEALTSSKKIDYASEVASWILEEANRCLRCGCGEGCQLCKTICTDFAPQIVASDELQINVDACVACGMCYLRCPNQIIDMICVD
ncbi:MAG: 4Fe-4S binding protein [Fastidiosipila sp.]|nr:4Fe-4S binding protein [Fastidiosipila sp.]